MNKLDAAAYLLALMVDSWIVWSYVQRRRCETMKVLVSRSGTRAD